MNNNNTIDTTNSNESALLDQILTTFSNAQEQDGYQQTKVFQNAGELVEIVKSNDGLSTRTIQPANVGDTFTRHLSFTKGTGDEAKATTLSSRLETKIVKRASLEPIPSLSYIIPAPVLVSKEETAFVVSGSGFHPGNSMFIGYNHEIDKMPVEEAKAVIEDLIAEFPFQDQASKANWIAGLLEPFVRPFLGLGNTPLKFIDASQPSSGKTTLAKLAVAIFTGEDPSTITASNMSKADAFKGELRSVFSARQPFVIFDNMKGVMDSEELEALLTDSYYTCQMKYKNEQGKFPNSLTYWATANQGSASQDLVTRSLYIRLVPDTTPEERDYSSFSSINIIKDALKNRGRIISAVVCLIQNWLDKGQPAPEKLRFRMPEYEQTIGGILLACGIDGFLENMQVLNENVNAYKGYQDNFRLFVQMFWNQFKGEKVHADALLEFAEESGIYSSNATKPAQWNSTEFGKKLGKLKDKPVVLENGLRVQLFKQATNGKALYYLMAIEAPAKPMKLKPLRKVEAVAEATDQKPEFDPFADPEVDKLRDEKTKKLNEEVAPALSAKLNEFVSKVHAELI